MIKGLQMRRSAFVAIISFLSFHPFSVSGQPQSDEEVVANLMRLGGKVWKDADGNIDSILLMVKKPRPSRFRDEDIESIDFTRFPALKSLVILSPEISDR